MSASQAKKKPRNRNWERDTLWQRKSLVILFKCNESSKDTRTYQKARVTNVVILQVHSEGIAHSASPAGTDVGVWTVCYQ